MGGKPLVCPLPGKIENGIAMTAELAMAKQTENRKVQLAKQTEGVGAQHVRRILRLGVNSALHDATRVGCD